MPSSAQIPNLNISRLGSLLETTRFRDIKDPCPVFDGQTWHIYGSGGTVLSETWKILHATAPTINGPWIEQEPISLDGVDGDHVAAPGVVRESGEQLYHMFVQKDFMGLGGTVEHLTSIDGVYFKKLDTPLLSIPNSQEAGIYDPHPAVINGDKYLVYAAADNIYCAGEYFVGRPNIFLAKSSSGNWYGPWERLGAILKHEDVAWHHNQLNCPDYEWGLEGPQLIGLPNGKVLLLAVCFLPYGPRGTRQRVFFAIADQVTGPYRSLGPILDPIDGWGQSETGHAAGVVSGDNLNLFYQARSLNAPWRYGLATIPLSSLQVF